MTVNSESRSSTPERGEERQEPSSFQPSIVAHPKTGGKKLPALWAVSREYELSTLSPTKLRVEAVKGIPQEAKGELVTRPDHDMKVTKSNTKTQQFKALAKADREALKSLRPKKFFDIHTQQGLRTVDYVLDIFASSKNDRYWNVKVQPTPKTEPKPRIRKNPKRKALTEKKPESVDVSITESTSRAADRIPHYSTGLILRALRGILTFEHRGRLPQFYAAVKAFLDPTGANAKMGLLDKRMAIFDLRIQTLLAQAWLDLLVVCEALNLTDEELYKVQSRSFDIWKALLESEAINIVALRTHALQDKNRENKGTVLSKLHEDIIDRIASPAKLERAEILPTRLIIGTLDSKIIALLEKDRVFRQGFDSRYVRGLVKERFPDGFWRSSAVLKYSIKTPQPQSREPRVEVANQHNGPEEHERISELQNDPYQPRHQAPGRVTETVSEVQPEPRRRPGRPAGRRSSPPGRSLETPVGKHRETIEVRYLTKRVRPQAQSTGSETFMQWGQQAKRKRTATRIDRWIKG